MAIPISTMIGAVINSSVIAVLPNRVVIVIILVSAITGLIATIMGVYVATSLVHCADEAAITFAASATSITDSTHVGISQEEEVDECITSPTVEKVSSVKETII